MIIRNNVYNYIINNKCTIYEYCTVENNLYYISIKIKNKTIKYFKEDYIENIKKDGFYAVFLEINTISNIYNILIIILNKNIYIIKKYFIINIYYHLDYKNLIIIILMILYLYVL